MGLLIRLGIFVLLSFGLITTNKNFFLRDDYKIKSVEITGVNEDISKDFFFFKDKFIGKSLSNINLKEIKELIRYKNR